MQYVQPKIFSLSSTDTYTEDISYLNDKLNAFGVSFKISENEYGHYLNIYVDEDKISCVRKRNAGRKPVLLKTDDTELQKQVDKIGIHAVAEENGVSVRTIQRRLKKWGR